MLSPTNDTTKYALSNQSDVLEVKFFDSSRQENPGEIEFILIGCDGIWEGGDFNDNPEGLPNKKEGVSVVKYVGQQIEERLKTESDR